MDRLMSVLMILSIGLLLMVLSSVRRQHIRVEYSVTWLIAGFILLILSRRPLLVDWLAELLGLEYRPAAILLVTMALFVVVFYRFSIRISELKDANIALTQRLAILEFQFRSSHEEPEAPKYG
jgi:hypothetical protein